MKLESIKELSGNIKAVTGIKIGGTKDSIGMGETDNPIIRHAVTRLPYIPGSSIKGKLRSLLEQIHCAESQRTGLPCDCGNCTVCNLFGCGNAAKSSQPTRLIFRDAPISAESRDTLENALPGAYVEVKTEIQMDRNAGKTKRGSLRQQERVPSDSIFDLSISVRLFAEDSPDDRKEYLEKLAEAFDLLEKDYLGGNGTRGYGKVKITHVTADGTQQPMSEYLRGLTW